MKKITIIGLLLKKIYRSYSQELLSSLQGKGFIDLRASFLDILSFICENDSPSIKEVGMACGLKKQTMTSHLNELEKRGYIIREVGQTDRRELKIKLTPYGEKFKIALIAVMVDIENEYLKSIGDVEMDRVIHTLENFYQKTHKTDEGQKILI